MEVIIGLLIGLALGFPLAWFLKGQRSTNAAHAAEAENLKLQAQLTAAGDARQFLAAAETQLKAATAEALQNNQNSFLTLANENLGKTLAAAQGELEQRHRQFSDLVKPLAENYGSLNPRLENLNTVTGRLAGALADARQVGLWGEMQLRRVVEMAGMLPYSDFTEQPAVNGSRPDLIIQLPGSRSVIIDAKASLLAYQEAQEAADEAQAAAALERHAANMKTQVTDLSGKNYGALLDDSLDFTVMFVPGDQFLSAALRADPGLLEYAMSRNIVLATPGLPASPALGGAQRLESAAAGRRCRGNQESRGRNVQADDRFHQLLCQSRQGAGADGQGVQRLGQLL